MKSRPFVFVRRLGFLLTIAGVLGVCAQQAHCQTPVIALLIQQSPVDGGRVSPTPGVYRLEPNSEVALSAMPQRGYQFVYWLGDVGDPTSSTTTAYLDKPKIIIAVFEPIRFDQSIAGTNVAGGEQAGSGGGGFQNSGLIASFGSGFFAGGGGAINTPTGGGTEGDYIGPTGPPTPPEPPQPPGVPEPATMLLLGLGGLSLLKRR